MHAYMNAHQWISDERRVELTPEGHFAAAWRQRAEGPLAGFYAALAISPRSLVTYSETQALIAASESRMADIPLPPGARLDAVERLTHDGRAEPHPYDPAGPHTIRLHIEDAAGGTFLLRIRYALPRG